MNRVERAIVVGVSVLLVLNVVATGYLLFGFSALDDRMDTIESEQDALTDQLLHVGQGGEASDNNGGDVEVRQGDFMAYDNGPDEGIVLTYEYQPLPGGDIYFDTSEVTVEDDFQQSARDAQAAVDRSEYDPVMSGMRIAMDTPDDWEFIRGESAGLAIAVQLAGMDPAYERDDSVAVTGQIEPDGNVVSVNHVTEKAEAARDDGKDVLVAPHTTGSVQVDGIEVVHVQTMDEAFEYALTPADDGDVDGESDS